MVLAPVPRALAARGRIASRMGGACVGHGGLGAHGPLAGTAGGHGGLWGREILGAFGCGGTRTNRPVWHKSRRIYVTRTVILPSYEVNPVGKGLPS